MNLNKIEFPVQDTYYKLNSDNKIELHLPGKEDYKNLPEEIKKDIKSGFIWGRMRGAWVSRSKGGNVPYSMRKYIIPYSGNDELKSFEDSEEQKTARLEAKADRFKTYAQNAEKRAENLQSDFNRLRKDWSWLTQPNINSSAGRSFANSRNRVMARYDRGMEERIKAEGMAEYARRLEISASQDELKNLGYLRNRVDENKKMLKKFPDFEQYYNKAMTLDKLDDETLMHLDGRMNFFKQAFDKYEYYNYYLETLIAEMKESGQYFDEATAKKTIKKEFKAFLKEYFNINLLSIRIGYKSVSGAAYYYKTDKPLPEMFHSGWAADNVAQMKLKQLYILMEKVKNTTTPEESNKQHQGTLFS